MTNQAEVTNKSMHIREKGAAFLAKVEAARQNPSAAKITVPTITVFECDVCNGMGRVTKAVPIDHSDFGKSFPCPNPKCEAANEIRQKVWLNKIKTARVPETYQGYTFQTWDRLAEGDRAGKTLAWVACALFTEIPDHYVSTDECYQELGKTPPIENTLKNSIMLFGDVGTGKTGLVVATLNALLSKGQTGLYIRARDLVEEIQKRYRQQNIQDKIGDPHDMSSEDVFAEFKQAPVLVIDEFNILNVTPDRSEIFETLMRYRYGNSLPTLMTANVNQQQFTEMWGERTADVVKAMAHWIPVGGVKLRETHAPLEEI